MNLPGLYQWIEKTKSKIKKHFIHTQPPIVEAFFVLFQRETQLFFWLDEPWNCRLPDLRGLEKRSQTAFHRPHSKSHPPHHKPEDWIRVYRPQRSLISSSGVLPQVFLSQTCLFEFDRDALVERTGRNSIQSISVLILKLSIVTVHSQARAFGLLLPT
jgi:hypothetical protein